MNNTEKRLEEYDKKFPCIETECDNNGTMVGYDREGDAEQQQCQHCFERRLPQKAFLTESIAQAIAEEKARVRGVMKEYPNKLFELNNGKMPWVIFQGKADEEEKFTLYKLGFEDAVKILASPDKTKE